VATRIDNEKFQDMIASGEIQLPDSYKTDFGFVGELDEDDPNYQGLFSMYNQFMDPLKQFVGPAITSLTGVLSGIPGASFLLNTLQRSSQPNVPNPLALGVYRDPMTGFFKDKFGYNVGPTLMKSNFLEPGTSSFRSYALEGLKSLDKQKADSFYKQNYGLTFDQVKSAIQSKDDPFDSYSDPNVGTSDYQGDVGPTGESTSGANVEGSVSRGGTDDTPGTPFKRGGIVDIYG
jgi:hypothetical protein